MGGRGTLTHRAFAWLNVVLGCAGAIGILAMVGLTVVGVFWRYILNDAIFGITDMSVLTASVVVSCAVVFAAINHQHIAITLIEGQLGRKSLRWVDMLVHLLSAATLLAAAKALWDKSRCGFDCGDITDNLGLLHQPYYIILSVSMLLCALFYLWRWSIAMLGSAVNCED